jgi:hypothetical protein
LCTTKSDQIKLKFFCEKFPEAGKVAGHTELNTSETAAFRTCPLPEPFTCKHKSGKTYFNYKIY